MSGGTSVWTLLKSPLAKGLFSTAVVMSGSTVQNASLAKAEADNLVFLRKTDCTDLACLRSLSVTQILQVGLTDTRNHSNTIKAKKKSSFTINFTGIVFHLSHLSVQCNC